MTKIYKFDPVLYPFPILVSKEFDPKKLCELYYVMNTDEEAEEADVETFVPKRFAVARTIAVISKKTGTMYFMILLIRPGEIASGTITHESVHVSNNIAELCNFLPEKAMNDEPTAYLAQWVANCISSVKQNKPDVMKGELLVLEE